VGHSAWIWRAIASSHSRGGSLVTIEVRLARGKPCCSVFDAGKQNGQQWPETGLVAKAQPRWKKCFLAKRELYRRGVQSCTGKEVLARPTTQKMGLPPPRDYDESTGGPRRGPFIAFGNAP